MRRFAFACAVVSAFSGFQAEAATVTVTDVESSWTDVAAHAPATVKGTGTSSLTWGTASSKKTGQSGYSFADASSMLAGTAGFDVGQSFVLGTFTHHHNPIKSGTSITKATLNVAIDLMIDGTSRAVKSTFDFLHWETDNAGAKGICANNQRNKRGVNAKGCADQVKIQNILEQTDEFQIGDAMYIMTITGFLVDGVFATEFWTRESASNPAQLVGVLQKVRDVTPPPPPPPPSVPLPATGWLVLAGLGGLAGLKRRRRG